MKPVLFLDFDRTLFDTDQFYDWLGADRFERILALSAGKITPPDFASMLYPDAVAFLIRARRTHRVVILTYALNIVLQRKKLRGSGIIPLVDDVIITTGEGGSMSGKGIQAREYLMRTGESGWEHTFVDDAPENIDEMKKLNPKVRCIRIDRTASFSNAPYEALVPPDEMVKDLGELGVML